MTWVALLLALAGVTLLVCIPHRRAPVAVAWLLLAGALALAAVDRADAQDRQAAAWCSSGHVPACLAQAKAEQRAEALHRRHVRRTRVRARWRQAVQAYGPGLLAARAACESTSDYTTTAHSNGFWFAHQFEIRAWTGAGGRYSRRLGRPVGRWTVQPTRLEQDYRAVVWDGIHGGDPWPHCP